jgi:predicted SAM-dependent methyltransferase
MSLVVLSAARETIAIAHPADNRGVKTFLHVGCGHGKKTNITRAFSGPEWQELRLDIDEAVHPDIVGTMIDMHAVKDGSVDAVFSSHNIEHLYPHEVPRALSEFLRVLKPEGFAVVTCPDLQSVAALIAEDKLTEEAYHSAAGPISPLDILYGHRRAMAAGNLFMAHHCGFTKKVLTNTLHGCGFSSIASMRRAAPAFDLWVVASKRLIAESEVEALAVAHFP